MGLLLGSFGIREIEYHIKNLVESLYFKKYGGGVKTTAASKDRNAIP